MSTWLIYVIDSCDRLFNKGSFLMITFALVENEVELIAWNMQTKEEDMAPVANMLTYVVV